MNLTTAGQIFMKLYLIDTILKFIYSEKATKI